MNESGKSLEEMSGFLLNDAENRKQARVHQLRAQQATAQKISELVGDPRWEVWSRDVETIRDEYGKRSDVAKSKLLNKMLLGDEYLAVKVEQMCADAAYVAVARVLNLAKMRLEMGEKAVEALKTVDNQGEGANNASA